MVSPTEITETTTANITIIADSMELLVTTAIVTAMSIVRMVMLHPP